jgi:hypothetical protein
MKAKPFRLCPDCGEDLFDTLKRRCEPCRKAHRTRQKMAWFAANPEKVVEIKLRQLAKEKEARRLEREHLAKAKAKGKR